VIIVVADALVMCVGACVALVVTIERFVMCVGVCVVFVAKMEKFAMCVGACVVLVAKIERFVKCTGVCIMLVMVIVEAFSELLAKPTTTVSNGRYSVQVRKWMIALTYSIVGHWLSHHSN
jgi:hypothetical protein